jgi:hypothetical protein
MCANVSFDVTDGGLIVGVGAGVVVVVIMDVDVGTVSGGVIAGASEPGYEFGSF